MASTPELAATQRALEELRGRVAVLHDRYGDVAAVRRLANDVERFGIDLAEVGALPAPTARTAAAPGEDVVEIPGAAYDEPLWEGDDEGVGGHHRP